MEAAAVESDLELAYRLQLEEAMAASIATISINDGVNLQTLEKLETKFSHRLTIETETNRPYGEGSSSSSSSKSEDDSESVEGQALIEALKGAAAFKLNRIVVFCDYYLLYEFVSGQLLPKNKKTIDILDQVNLLRKNDISVDQFLSIEGCTHRYRYSCVKQHVEVKLLNGVLPKCPNEGCGNELRIESCEKFLNRRFTEMMRQRLKEDSIPVTEKVYCPNPRCSTLMSTNEALRHPVLVYGFGARSCYNFRANFCVYCWAPWHENMTCEEYKRRNPTSLVEESKLKNLAARNLWRQCIKCKHMIELAAGCYHMTYRCGYEFCYTCGAEWKNKKATCNCPFGMKKTS
ncbi:hypothetical protein L1987_08846 [Smallanthus sonchifolius]|uniref:Uncharacterized protein n=1 Tax=Smallanthus sonchifolius TaxID=185202 RepID=A0ACB9JMB9_9ASTR|nr:hypothetical protein L1987_08846 [Smallanthus sonchifolius]